jgi:hypothetical protein
MSLNLPVGSEENHEKPHDNRSAGRDLNPGPPEYDEGLLSIRPQRSVDLSYESSSMNSYPSVTSYWSFILEQAVDAGFVCSVTLEVNMKMGLDTGKGI